MPKPRPTLAILLAILLIAPALTPPLHAAPPQTTTPDATLDQAITTAEAIFTTSCDPSQQPPIHIVRELYRRDSPLGEISRDQGLYTLWQQITLTHKANKTTPTARQDIVFSHSPKFQGAVSLRSDSHTAIITTYPLQDNTFTVQGKRYTLDDLKLLLTAKN